MTRQGLFVLNEPWALRISPALAKEIGFHESIFLLQIEYLIQVSTTEEKDGRLWTYQSLKAMQQVYFPWWSIATISRIAKRCEDKGLIHIGNYNKLGYDRTQWYCLNEVGVGKLKSIRMNDAIFQNEKSKRAKRKMDTSKMKNGSAQNETPIPETLRIPPHINTPEFLNLWNRFEKMRVEIKHPVTDTAREQLMNKLGKYPLEKVIAATELAIENNWRGIFPESVRQKNGKPAQPTQYTEEH